MAFAVGAALAGATATAAYLDAKLLISHDLQSFPIAHGQKKALEYVAKQAAAGRLLTYHVLEDQALRQRPDQPFLIFEDRHWTYRQFYDDVQRVGNWLMNDLGIEKREVVALDGGNSPEYLLVWFGLEAIGAVPAFINSNLTRKPLVHCVQVMKSHCSTQTGFKSGYPLTSDVADLRSPLPNCRF